MSLSVALGLFAVSLLAALAALALVSFVPTRQPGPGTLFGDGESSTVLIFDDETLIDATASARALLAAVRMRGTAWQRFIAFAAPRFPGVEARLAQLADLGTVTMPAVGADPLTLRAEWRGGLRRITLIDAHLDTATLPYDSFAQRAQDDELAALRAATDRAPFPIWREAADGTILWVNDRYMQVAAAVDPAAGEATWPPPQLFRAPDRRGRVRVDLPGGSPPLWFDRTAAETGTGVIAYALPADAAAQAEASLRDFVQTLTMTFAHLPIGLAIFDRARRLQVFNPALTDLTALPAEFLSTRPSLNAVLDAMRDRRMIPEPKDYKHWRQRIAAGDGDAPAAFEETWSLPGDRTYRVIGRPHPEGALALLLEDITTEVSRVRTFRADLALGQSVLDALDEGIAVFARDGTLVQTNAAYAAIWSHDPGSSVAATSAEMALRHWADRCAPDPVWARIEAALAARPNGPARAAWEATLRQTTGRTVRCRIVPIAGGATLVAFTVSPAQR
ncbi:MAG: PAS-domain containing protein, partial [Gemmobacter sp.]